MSGGNDNKGTSWGALLGPVGAVLGMQYDQGVQASKDANDRVNDAQTADAINRTWQQKKKEINDKNAANAALRLRGGTPGANTPGVTGVTGQPIQPGVLGVGGKMQSVTDATNTPLGL